MTDSKSNREPEGDHRHFNQLQPLQWICDIAHGDLRRFRGVQESVAARDQDRRAVE